VVVEVVDLTVVGYIAEADRTADIAERKDIAGEEMDIVDLVLLAVGDSSVLCK